LWARAETATTNWPSGKRSKEEKHPLGKQRKTEEKLPQQSS